MNIYAGGYFMLLDTYNAGSSWLPLAARDDAYAVITGLDSASLLSIGHSFLIIIDIFLYLCLSG
jgi:hypothetical protein